MSNNECDWREFVKFQYGDTVAERWIGTRVPHWLDFTHKLPISEAKFPEFSVEQRSRSKFCLNLPASGALSIFSWMREPHVSETHVACIHLQYRKKEAEKNGDDKWLRKKKKWYVRIEQSMVVPPRELSKMSLPQLAVPVSSEFYHKCRIYILSFWAK